MRRSLAIALTTFAIVGLAGCAPEATEPTPWPSASPAPSFSDEELLAQARETYEGYLAASEAVAQSQPFDYTALSPYANDVVATNDVAVLEGLADAGYYVRGSVQITSFSISGTATSLDIQVSTCLDISAQRFVDAEGNDVTYPDRAVTSEMWLEFSREDSERNFLLTSQTPPAEGVEPACP